jgi:hypothetical protein
MRATLLLMTLLAAAVAPGTEARSMSDCVPFSKVQGQLLASGRPVPGQEVLQHWNWLGSKSGDARAVTDAEGRFTFPEMRLSCRGPQHDADVVQTIEVRHHGRTVQLWSVARKGMEANAELGGEPIVLVADLDQEPREVSLPVGPEALTVVSGMAQFRHPYLARWERTRAQVTPEGVARALAAYLASPGAAKRLATFFPAVGRERSRVAKVTGVSALDLTDGMLFADGEAGRYAVLEAPRYAGFTARARVSVALTSGETLTADFFAWKLLLPLDDSGRPLGDLRVSGTWELDTRSWIKSRADALLVPERVAALVRARLPLDPGASLLAALGAKPRAALTVSEAVAREARVVGVKDTTATLRFLGPVRLQVAGRDERVLVEASLAVPLASLAEAEYRLAPGREPPTYRPIPFAVTLSTDKSAYTAGEPITLRFVVRNTMGTPQSFLLWHTPFARFDNNYLHIALAGGGEPVGYTGALVSRAPPAAGDYRTLRPGESAAAEIEITQAYPVRARGEYVLRYSPLGSLLANEARFTIR